MTNFKDAYQSFWEREVYDRPYDLAIIGGGIVGLTSAIFYKKTNPKHEVVILERGGHSIGASSRNAGFACFGSVSELVDDLESMSENEFISLIKLRWEGLQILKNIVGEKKLDYRGYGGYEMFDNEEQADKYIQHIPRMNQLVKSAIGQSDTFRVVKNTFGFSSTDSLICNQYEGQIHTGRMLRELEILANQLGIRLLTNTTVVGWRKEAQINILLESHKSIRAKKLLVATNAFSQKLLPKEVLIPARNQVMITKPIEGLELKGSFHYDKGYVYFRNFENRILIGGGRNIDADEQIEMFGITTKIQNYLRSILNQKILPNTSWKEDMWWSGIIATGPTKEPIVKEVEENVFCAIRLGGMGVAMGSKIGEMVVNRINNKDS